MDPDLVVSLVLHFHVEYLAAQNHATMLRGACPAATLVPRTVGWVRPVEGYLKLNVDGVTFPQLFTTGVGAILRNS